MRHVRKVLVVQPPPITTSDVHWDSYIELQCTSVGYGPDPRGGESADIVIVVDADGDVAAEASRRLRDSGVRTAVFVGDLSTVIDSGDLSRFSEEMFGVAPSLAENGIVQDPGRENG